MTYQDTVNWLFKQLPMYQKQGKTAYKKDLSNTLKLANYLENPQKNFKSIHVGGTNGKGSCSHMLASILQEAGYKVGLYTSPHLKDYRERIKIDGREISKEYVVEWIAKHKLFFETNQLSFFEMTVGLAFDYFAHQNVDVAIIEVGLGGRLDSTNIIIPELSIITNIGFDHTQFLGETLPKIAFEKAGIIKHKIPVVIGESNPETKAVFVERAEEIKSDLFFADQLIDEIYESDLKGNYQSKNIKTVIQSVSILKQNGFSISQKQLKTGLKNVIEHTGLLGRWQILSENPKIICDTAHNKEGLSFTMKQLQSEQYENLHIVFGVVDDKKLDDLMLFLPKEAIYYLAKPNIPRGMDVKLLAKNFNNHNYQFRVFNSVNEAFMEAKFRSIERDVIYVGGSTFVVAEIL